MNKKLFNQLQDYLNKCNEVSVREYVMTFGTVEIFTYTCGGVELYRVDGYKCKLKFSFSQSRKIKKCVKDANQKRLVNALNRKV